MIKSHKELKNRPSIDMHHRRKNRDTQKGAGGISEVKKMHDTILEIFDHMEDTDATIHKELLRIISIMKWVLVFTAGIYVMLILRGVSQMLQ